VKIKELRIKHNLSQQDLADATKIPKGRINNWEQGRGNPKGADERTLTAYFHSLEVKVPQTSTSNKEPNIAEEVRLLIKNIDRIGDTNEYLLSRVKYLEDQLRGRK
jgi:transcriptional regulator with XRE-family HTH domain